MADLVIRGGTVVDGTGAPSFVGDVAVTGGVITEVGPNLAVTGKEEVDAHGLVITPGWIDAHTHFDAQWSWDPYLSPSTACGVTTCIMGNCGIGFAPCQQDRRDFLAYLVEAVEDIPGPVIAEGLKYDFETFEEYMNSIESKRFACDIGVMVGHCAVRTWVMGKRANLSDRPKGATENPVLPHEIKAIAGLVRDAVAKGALGFSTSRLLIHRDPAGVLTPGALAATQELRDICSAVAEGGGGIFQMSTDFSGYEDVPYMKMDPVKRQEFMESEFAWMEDVARQHRDKIGFSFNVVPGMEVALPHLDAINDCGSIAKGQCFPRAQGFLFAFGGRMQPFMTSRRFNKVQKQCEEAGVDMLVHLKDPENRKKIISETEAFFALKDKGPMQELANLFSPQSRVYLWTPGYEPESGKDDIKAVGEREGKSRWAVAYDTMVDGGVLWKPFAGYDVGNDTPRYNLFHHPHIVPGFSDGGAHGSVFQDASGATHMLTHFTRDRTRGDKMTIENAVRLSTSAVADLFGLQDRGVIAPGKKADINVLDMKTLKMGRPFLSKDLPLNQQRWNQEVEGYHLTLLAGQPTYKHGVATGVLPGTLVRNPRRNENAWCNISASVAGPLETGLAIPADADQKAHALLGSGSAGASAAARVLRDTVEGSVSAAPAPGQPLRSRL